MPLVFALLVILNAVFLAWQFFEQQNGAQHTSAVVENIAGKKLQLLSERPDLQSKATEGDAAPVTARVEVDAGVCYRVGPFTDQDLLLQLRTAFTNTGFRVKDEELTEDSSNYWVYIPPLTNPDKAEQLLQDLHSRGIDASLVTDSQFANAISLGRFSDQESADSLKMRLVDMGFRAESRMTPMVKRQHWLKISSTRGGDAKAQVSRLLAGNPQLRREPASCEI